VREAVDLAMALGREDRLQALLLRLTDVASAVDERRDDAAWALLELLRIKKAAGDLDGAANALARAAEVLPFDRVLPLARDLADRAGRAGNRRLGAELLERLRASAPADESVWRPLLDHYVQLGDRDGLSRLVTATLPLVAEVGPRNELRLALARLRLDADGTDREAADTLRDVLLEEPGRAEALTLLANYYERTGSEDDLADLLAQVFDAAVGAGEPEVVVAAALRLGGALERSDAERAVATYERALAFAPKRRELLQRLLALRPAGEIGRDDAARMEELLGLESGPDAERLARELAAAWTKLGDAAAARRALEKGYAQAGAGSALFDELEQAYRAEQDWKQLAELYATEGDRREDGQDGARLLLEAASLRRGRVADPRGALQILRRARARAPRDVQIVEQLARALVAHGDLAAAAAEVRAALEAADLDPKQRLALTLLRAKLEAQRGDHRAAVTVLQDAMASSPETVAPVLAAELEAWRQEAAATGATDDLREVTFNLADVARAAGDLGQARRLLAELTARGGSDAKTARLAWELAEAEGDADGVFVALSELVPTSTGETQITAARQLAALADRTGRAAEAAGAIEAAFAANPGQAELGELLAELYERAGELGKLAGLLLEQANRNPDDGQRFDQFTRAGALALQVGDGSVAVMSLNEALAIRPDDEQATLLLSDAYALSGAANEAAELLKPLIAACKGKPSPMLAGLQLRVAHLAALAGDRDGHIAALGQALEADKKNNELVAEIANRAEEAGDDELALKALRLIVANNAPGPMSVPAAFLRQAHIALRRGDADRAIMFARRAAHDSAKGDPVEIQAREFLAEHGTPAVPGKPRRTR
jgi:Tfp pilus assembly protein PilF